MGYFQFESATTLEQALNLLRRQELDRRINLIVLDWRLGRLSGNEVLAVLKGDQDFARYL